jgi:hypothetical protein
VDRTIFIFCGIPMVGLPDLPEMIRDGSSGRNAMKGIRFSAPVFGTLLSLACAHVPPSNVTRDRFDYAEAVAQSWKRQTLMNVVHLRYADAPVFLDVTSLINTYTRVNNVNASAGLHGDSDDNVLSAGASAGWSNSPTVTYQPVTGDKFAKQLLRPISPASLLQMMEAGWPAKLIFPIAVRTVNGLRGQVLGRSADPEFVQLVETLDRIQQSDGLGFRVSSAKPGENVLLVLSREEREAVRDEQETVRKLLGLETGLKEVEVGFGSVQRTRSEVAMVTRSMVEIMLELSAGIDLPPGHAEEGRVLPLGLPDAGRSVTPQIHIRSGTVAPGDAYAAIRYKGYAFWIDDRDIRSKRLFSFLMLLFSLAESGQPSAAPLVTISK